jgi:hypothetical protein
VDNDSVHFVDGGYYDNDGTASAIEFLRYALAPPSLYEKAAQNTIDPQSLEKEKLHLESIQNKIAQKHPLRILWIEIRNSGDWDGGAGQTAGGNGVTSNAWNLFDQIAAPPNTFWSAGHESVTGRNRVALGLFESAQHGKVEILRVVLADSTPALESEAHPGSVNGIDPLNWSLTPKQRIEVQTSAGKMSASYALAKSWYSCWPEKRPKDSSSGCRAPAPPSATKPGATKPGATKPGATKPGD